MRRRTTPVKHRAARPVTARPREATVHAERSAASPEAARSRGAAGGRGPKIDVQLAWARDRDGRKVHAGRLLPADRRGRAPFTCLGCGEPLVPHLGRVRARHFAHAPGSRCPLTAPETALHLDAKERLLALCADAFAGVRAVTLLARCPSCRRLAPRDLADVGDAAAAEGAVGPLRADVLVTRGGAAALAIEVKVTHAVEPEKEAALAVAGVPAVEVDAREAWEQADGPAVAIVCARTLGFPPCAACAVAARADRDRDLGGEAAELAELEAYRARGLFGPAPTGPTKLIGPGRGTLGRAREARDAGGGREEARDGGGLDGAPALSAADRDALSAGFSCPECGSGALVFGDRIARHACEGKTARPIAWRGYDGELVLLSWWRRDRGRPTHPPTR